MTFRPLAAAVGDTPAHVCPFDGNARAEALHRRHGFARDGAREHDGAGVDVVRTVRDGSRQPHP